MPAVVSKAKAASEVERMIMRLILQYVGVPIYDVKAEALRDPVLWFKEDAVLWFKEGRRREPSQL